MKGIVFAAEDILILLFAVAFVHQVLWPALVGRKLFHLFRSKDAIDRQIEKAERDATNAAKALELAEKQERIRQLERKTDNLLFKE